MADLIDFNSPTNKKLQTALPSPLIPPPENVSSKLIGVNLSELGRSIDNNPFDMVLRQTAEYVSKASDPFEIVFEEATSNHAKNITEGQLQKSKQYTDILNTPDIGVESEMLRRIKTDVVSNDDTEVPSIMVELPSPGRNLSLLNLSSMTDSFQLNLDRVSTLKKLPGDSNSLEKSLLSSSMMNDTLSLTENSVEDPLNTSDISKRLSMCVQKGLFDAKFIGDYVNNFKMRRSFSQGDGISPRKYRQKFWSIIDKKTSMFSDNSLASRLSEDPLNMGFMSREKSEYSIGNDLSELSSIIRLNSINSSSCFTASAGAANKGFIDSYCGGAVGGSEKTRSKTSDLTMQELIAKFQSLKSKSMIECGFKKSNAESRSKLELHEGSDSVFLHDSKEISICNEANILAKTFEDLAAKSAKESTDSGENLLNIYPSSNVNLSPETSEASHNMGDVAPSSSELYINTNTTANSSCASKSSPESTKKEVVVNLLRDLEKVVQTEDKPEIIKHLKNLEKALGFTGAGSVDLVTMCCQAQSKSDNKSGEKLKVNSPKASDKISPKKLPKVLPEKFKKSPMKKSSKSNDKSLKEIQVAEYSPKQRKTNVEIQEKNTDGNYNEAESNNGESEKSSEDNTELPHDLVSSTENINVNTTNPKALKPLSSSLQDSFSTQKLILDIQLAVGKLLADCKDEPALVLENLNKVLKPTDKQPSRSSISPRKLSLSYRTMKSQNRQTSIKLEKTRNSLVKRADSPKKELAKQRNTTDPGIDIKIKKKSVNISLKIKSTVPVVDRIKLNKTESTMAAKKGPMKALAPLGSMQRNESNISQVVPSGTPPKRQKIPSPLKIATSTPQPSPVVLGKKMIKTKPAASSTPDVVNKAKFIVPPSPKNTTSWNISPVTPNAKGDVKSLFDSTQPVGKCSPTPKKINKSLDRSIKDSSSLTGRASHIKDGVIHGRRSEPLQLTSPRVNKAGARFSANLLKEKNVMMKAKPINLNVKFENRSGSLNGGEKENKF